MRDLFGAKEHSAKSAVRWGWLGVAGVVCVALGMAACGTSSSSSVSSSSATSAAPGVSSSRGSGSGSTALSTTSTTAGLVGCKAAGLLVSVEGTSGAAGTIEMTIALKNTSGAPCQLYGYPGMELIGPSGNALPTTVDRGGSLSFENIAPSEVILANQATAWFNVGYSQVAASSCPTASSLVVTPPGAYDHATVPVQIVACNGVLTTSAVFGAGSPATETTAPPHP